MNLDGGEFDDYEDGAVADGGTFTDPDPTPLEMMRDFIALGEKDSVKYDEEKYRTSEQLLKDIVKGLIARGVYGDQSAYNVIINHRNRDVQAA